MNELKEMLVKYGIESVLNIGEVRRLIPKTTVKMVKAKRRCCKNEEIIVFCITCPFKYGGKECKKFRNRHNMKINLFPSIPEIMGKFYGRL